MAKGSSSDRERGHMRFLSHRCRAPSLNKGCEVPRCTVSCLCDSPRGWRLRSAMSDPPRLVLFRFIPFRFVLALGFRFVCASTRRNASCPASTCTRTAATNSCFQKPWRWCTRLPTTPRGGWQDTLMPGTREWIASRCVAVHRIPSSLCKACGVDKLVPAECCFCPRCSKRHRVLCRLFFQVFVDLSFSSVSTVSGHVKTTIPATNDMLLSWLVEVGYTNARLPNGVCFLASNTPISLACAHTQVVQTVQKRHDAIEFNQEKHDPCYFF